MDDLVNESAEAEVLWRTEQHVGWDALRHELAACVWHHKVKAVKGSPVEAEVTVSVDRQHLLQAIHVLPSGHRCYAAHVVV